MTPPVISRLAIFIEFLINNETFHSLKTTIWNNLITLLIGSGIDKEIIFDNIMGQLQVHLIVLNHLRSPEVKKKKNLRVTFEETEEVFRPTKLFFSDNYKTDLTNFVIVVLQFYLDKTSYPDVGQMYVNHVWQVILAYKNYGIVSKLSQTLPVLNEKTSPSFSLYENYVKIWINDDKVLTYNLISVIVGLLDTVDNEEERLIMIKDLNLVIIHVYYYFIVRDLYVFLQKYVFVLSLDWMLCLNK